MRQTFRNQTASLIPTYVQLSGRHEFSKGPPQSGTLAKKAPLIKNYIVWQRSKNDLCRFGSQSSTESKNEIKLGRFHPKKTEL
jgi:hypothetical protein